MVILGAQNTPLREKHEQMVQIYRRQRGHGFILDRLTLVEIH